MAVYCLTARKWPQNSYLPLGLAISILRKMPTSWVSLLPSVKTMVF